MSTLSSKAYQPKYKDCSSAWNEFDIFIKHGDSVKDFTFADLVPGCKSERVASVVLIDGIRLLNPEAIREIGLKKTEIAVNFNEAEVKSLNTKVSDVLKITEESDFYQVRLCWVPEAVTSEVSSHGSYYTTSQSRGKTTKGQGAVDFLTAAALYAEACRNLLFDEVKNRLSLIVLERFINFRTFFLLNEHRIINHSLKKSEKEKLSELIILFSDALYMSGAYYENNSNFVKRKISTEELMQHQANKPITEEILGSEVFNPEFLSRLVKAYI